MPLSATLLHPNGFATPVVLIVFNRPDLTSRIFNAIAAIRPTRMLIIADGPREGREGEEEACRRVREIVSSVDWTCDVSTDFADRNLGCQERIVSGLNWVFSLVEEAIILEDDCLPDPSFFPFCREMLERYRNDSRVGSISGTNLVAQHVTIRASYFFSEIGGNWGWATWKSQWQLFERYLESWPTLKGERALSEIFDDPKTVSYWTFVFDQVYERRGPSAWDYQWVYGLLKNHVLAIVPRVNLVSNIGFGDGATHTQVRDPRLTPPVSSLDFPLTHPSDFIPLRSLDRQYQKLTSTSIFRRIANKLRKFRTKWSFSAVRF